MVLEARSPRSRCWWPLSLWHLHGKELSLHPAADQPQIVLGICKHNSSLCLCLHVAFPLSFFTSPSLCICLCVQISPSYQHTVQIRAHSTDLIWAWLSLYGFYIQIWLHSEVLGFRTSTCKFLEVFNSTTRPIRKKLRNKLPISWMRYPTDSIAIKRKIREYYEQL